MKNYECVRCGYTTNKKSTMVSHLNKRKTCIKNEELCKYNDEEAKEISLQKKYNTNIGHNCEYCKKNYITEYTLKRHINNYCKEYTKTQVINGLYT